MPSNTFLIKSRRIDILINVIAPLLVGCSFYLPLFGNCLPQLLRNYVPDAIWAYAFQSLILIIWERKVQLNWTIIAIISGGCFEYLQYSHAFSGTGDVLDFLLYTLFILIAVALNDFMSSKYLNHHYVKDCQN